jgi:hypothetical protein
MALGAHLKLYKPVIRRDAGVKTAYSIGQFVQFHKSPLPDFFSCLCNSVKIFFSRFTFKHTRLFSRTINGFFSAPGISSRGIDFHKGLGKRDCICFRKTK